MNMKHQKSIWNQIAPYSADVLNPFSLKCTVPLYQKLKTVVITVTVLPVRIVVMFCLLLSAWILGITTLRGLPEEERTAKKPLSGWRRRWMKPLISEISRLVFAVAGWHWIPTKGKRASPKEAPILLLVPHTSFWDTVPVVALRCPCMVVKDSTETTPFFGTLINYTQPVFVRRDDPKSRQHTVDEIMRRVKSGDNWEQIIIFPEGTCGNRRALIDFKLGAFYPGVPIQPVFIRYSNRLDTITWTWNGPGTLRQIWMTLTQLHIYCELEFLPVYSPSDMEKDDPRLFANNLRRSISMMCDIPMSYFSLEDVRYLDIAQKVGLPKTAALIKLLRLRKKIGHETMNVKDEMALISNNLALLGKTLCNLEDFTKCLGTDDVSEIVKDFFYLLDQEKKEKIDVRIYIAGLWLLNTKISQWKRLEHGFKVFDSQGIITEPQFAAIALLWRGLPRKIASDVFYVINLDRKDKRTLSFKKFKSVVTCFFHLEKSSNEKSAKKFDDGLSNGRSHLRRIKRFL